MGQGEVPGRHGRAVRVDAAAHLPVAHRPGWPGPDPGMGARRDEPELARPAGLEPAHAEAGGQGLGRVLPAQGPPARRLLRADQAAGRAAGRRAAATERTIARERSAPLHVARSAVATGRRAARSAGSEPPMSPIASAHAMLMRSRCGVTVSLKISPATSTTLPLNSAHAMPAPRKAPGSASTIPSSRTDTMIGPALKPMARSVAISRRRASTEPYRLLSAPNTAPLAMTAPTK